MEIVPGYSALLGEGVIRNHEEQKLYWIDIEGKKIIIQDTTLYPGAGALFACKPGVRGIKQALFHIST
ncbi:MAG: hypothetical protein JXJ04_26405 [Spirochaetales bacterium]|nr:hypothetical protein [Spirochaetales bacterium]